MSGCILCSRVAWYPRLRQPTALLYYFFGGALGGVGGSASWTPFINSSRNTLRKSEALSDISPIELPGDGMGRVCERVPVPYTSYMHVAHLSASVP